MKLSVEKLGKAILSNDSTNYLVEVGHGGYGGHLGEGMLVSCIFRTKHQLGDGPNQWEAQELIFLSLDKEAAVWLADAIGKVVEGTEVGLRKSFSKAG